VFVYVPSPREEGGMSKDEELERARYERIGRLFCELWEMGAPWPVRRWTCNAHMVVGCPKCIANADATRREG
jgi:hypothetical protein